MLRIFNQYFPRQTLFLFVFENLLIWGAIQLAAFIRLDGPEYLELTRQGLLFKAFLITLVCQICLYFHDLYDLRIVRDGRELFVRLLQSLGVSSILVAAIYLLLPWMFLGHGVFILAIFIVFSFFIAWRVGVLWLQQKHGLAQPLLVVGTGDMAQKLAVEILNRPEIGLRISGFLSEDRTQIGRSLINPRVIGHSSEVTEIVEREKINRIAVALPDSRGKLPVNQLLDLKLRGFMIEEATSLYEKVTGKIAVENLRPSWLIFSEGFRKSRPTLFLKRISGMCFSIVGLLLSLPVMAIIAILIKLDSKGPIFFKQERVGENGRLFRVLKFRSMFADAESDTGPVWAKENDQRVTRVGRFIRKFRLDEMPQFFNVLLGDMSFVGPRPERPHFVKHLSEEIPYYNLRHTVKPGITGWAQIKYKYGSTLNDNLEKLQYDLFYIKNMSFSLDLLIVFQTIKIVILRRGAV
jgi:sugar transferase (PEP-CTERM system associated)